MGKQTPIIYNRRRPNYNKPVRDPTGKVIGWTYGQKDAPVNHHAVQQSAPNIRKIIKNRRIRRKTNKNTKKKEISSNTAHIVPVLTIPRTPTLQQCVNGTDLQISNKFMKNLSDSLKTNSKIVIQNMDDWCRLQQKISDNTTVMQLLLVVFIFFYHANLPVVHLPFLLGILILAAPWMKKHLLPKTESKFQSDFTNVFCDNTHEIFKLGGDNCMLFFDLEKKMQEKFSNNRFRTLLHAGKMRIIQRNGMKSFEKFLEDINDGSMMRRLNNGYLMYQQNLSFQIFIDGVSPFKGSSHKLIPVYIVNLQIDLENRFKLENMIMIGLLSIKGEFDVQIFYTKLVERLNQKLQKMILKLGEDHFECHALVTSIICDMKERESIFNFSSGYFGCFFCTEKGELISKKVVYPHTSDSKLRNASTFKCDCFIAQNFLKDFPNSKNFRGVKCESPLSSLRGVILPFSCPVDPMHTIDCGLVKYFLEMWLGKKKWFTKFAIKGDELKDLNSILDSVKIPDFITRRPRSLLELHYWKCDEFKNFAIYFFPLMEKFLPSPYYEHFKLFARAYRILSSNSIHISQFRLAEKLIKEFTQKCYTLYAKRVFTMKIHCVCYHLLDHVLLFGPLSHFSAKRFEDCNGKLMRKNYGKNNIAEQLIQFSFFNIQSFGAH